jgi:hypothetical protein
VTVLANTHHKCIQNYDSALFQFLTGSSTLCSQRLTSKPHLKSTYPAPKSGKIKEQAVCGDEQQSEKLA